MKCVLVVAVSSDWFIADMQNSDVSKWTSPEDKQFFRKKLNEFKLYVFGKNTYDAVNPEPSAKVLRVILTHKTEKYQNREVVGQIEFNNLTPKQFIRKYEKLYDSCLILGGSVVYKDFIVAGLVNEIFLTIEPIYLKAGIAFPKTIDQLENLGYVIQSDKLLNQGGTRLINFIRIHK
jgi:dihydrofolate reductase